MTTLTDHIGQISDMFLSTFTAINPYVLANLAYEEDLPALKKIIETLGIKDTYIFMDKSSPIGGKGVVYLIQKA